MTIFLSISTATNETILSVEYFPINLGSKAFQLITTCLFTITIVIICLVDDECDDYLDVSAQYYLLFT